jgi:hypothetical protein
MNILKHYRDNKKEGMAFFKNIKDIFFHLHNGKKRILVCIIALVVNYIAYKHSISINEWILLLSTEYFILKLSEALTSEGLYK